MSPNIINLHIIGMEISGTPMKQTMFFFFCLFNYRLGFENINYVFVIYRIKS